MVHNKSLHFVKKVVDDNFFFRRMMLAVVAGWISLNIRAFQISFHRNFVRLVGYTVCWLVKEFTVKRFIQKRGEGESMSLAR